MISNNNQALTRQFSRLLLASLAFVLPATSNAHAEEFSMIDHWAGAYAGLDLNFTALGGEINRGAGQKDFSEFRGSVTPGLHLGYNFSPLSTSRSGGWLFGTQMDLSFTNIDHKKTDSVLGDVKLESTFLAAARLRAGYAFNNFYLYGTAGLALSDLTVKPVSNKDDQINLGLTFGAGVEYMMTDKWTMRLEALAYDFGDKKYKFNGTSREVDRAISTIRVGFSRKF